MMMMMMTKLTTQNKAMRKEIQLTYEGNNMIAAVNVNTTRAYSRERGLKTVQAFQTDLAYEGDQEDIPFEVLDRYALFFLCALREGARINKQPCDFSIEDVYLIMEENQSVLRILMTATYDEMDPPTAPQKGASRGRKKKN